jgi:hypothetical protein
MSQSSLPAVRPSNVRAPLVLARVDWVKRHHGQAGLDGVLAAMDPDRAAIVRSTVSPALWLPFDTFVNLCEAIDRVHGRGDLALVPELARHAARVNIPTIHKIFFRLGSVEYIVRKAAAVWSASYDTGTASSEVMPGVGLRLIIERLATPHRVHCLTVLGWVEEMVRLVGPKVIGGREIECRTQGAPRCTFEVLYR